jgi:cyclopropane-fatty-acyl-phospholipid synthase
LPNGRVLRLGEAHLDRQPAPVTVAVTSWPWLGRIIIAPALAVGEAYAEGAFVIERGGLDAFMALATRNLHYLTKPAYVPRNDRLRARRNVARHYDLPSDLYTLFLDPDRQYSCAYFESPDVTLAAAQEAKKRHIAMKLNLSRGMDVLDIGSGWGGMALTLAKHYGARVTGITLSQEQLHVARRRAQEHGLEACVGFHLCDYRDAAGVFDRIVSVGMFEHVGVQDYANFFDLLSRRLKPDGVALLHTIGCSGPPQANNPWIERYIFPGGYIPSLSQIAAAVERSGLIIADVEVLRLHYAETIKAWRANFAARQAEAARLLDDRFRRMWNFYLAGAESGFRHGRLEVFQLQLIKSQAALPITRDYMLQDEQRRELSLAAAE